MSWYELLDIREQARQEFDYYASRPPLACPNDGEPLTVAPTGWGDAGADCELFCRFDGFQYPRDWIRPEQL